MSLKAQLEAMGHEVILAPVLAIRPCAPERLGTGHAQAVIATSRNAMSAIAGHPDLASLTGLPIFVVGPKTGALARQLGFRRVIEGPGSAQELVPLIGAEANPTAGSLLHLAGETLAFDLKGALASAGLGYTSAIVYKSEPAENLPSETITAIRAGAIDAAIVMSPRTAEHLATLYRRAEVEGEARRIAYLAISAATAKALEPLAPQNVTIAARPTLEEVLALVTKLAAKSGKKNA